MAEEDVSLNLQIKNRRETVAGLRDVERGIDRTGDEAERAGRQAAVASTGFSRMGKAGRLAGKASRLAFGGVLAAGFAAAGVLKGAFSEAQEARKVTAQTNAVIKATGGVAGVTARHVDKLSTSISNKIGVDDEVIASSANVLLAFRDVRNEQGKGNAIFDRATVAAQDMAAQFGGSGVSNAKKLGKALNDPTKGLTVLARAGAKFTDEQREQIQAMQESGNMLGAQRALMDALEGSTKGSAASQATAADKAGVAWGNLQEKIGLKLAPTMDRFFNFLTTKGIPALEAMGPTFDKIGGWISTGVTWIKTLFRTFSGGEGTSRLAEAKATFLEVFESIKVIVNDAVVIVTALWNTFGADLVRYGKSALTNLLTVVRGAFTFLKGIFQLVRGIVTGDWRMMWEGIKNIVKGAWGMLRGIVQQGWNFVRLVFSAGRSALSGIWNALWSGIKQMVGAAWEWIKGKVRGGLEAIVGFVRGLGGKISSAASAAFEGLKSAFRGAINFVIDGWNGLSFSFPGIDPPGPGSIPGFTVSTPNVGRLEKGGPAQAGMPYIVGERRPELFVPDTNGTVIPSVDAPLPPRLGSMEWQEEWDQADVTAGSMGGTTVVQVTLDGRVLTEVVLDELERKGGRR